MSQTQLAPPLPVARFRKVEDDVPKAQKNKQSGVHDQQAQSFGYNKPGELFLRPAQYIHYVEPLETELAVRVEYDLDEQDQEWIDSINADRKKEQLDTVTYEIFEVIMDRLEKEYFELMKHVPKPESALPSEDSTCTICDDGEGENSNVIVFCDGCNLAVHQDCYGVPYIPEGQWLCRKCTVSPESPVSCVLCPNEGGAFKQTTTGQWVHLLCAIWIPEVSVGNMTFMEPIEHVNRIPKNRLKLTCSICRLRGPCIQCDNKSCFAAFHVTCARQEKLLAPMKALPGVEEAPPLRAFCEKHLPHDLAEARQEALEEQEANAAEMSPGRKGKAARAYAKNYNLGPPPVPWIIVEHILAYTQRVTIRKKKEFVSQVCKYWSLKREARRGAPLLKRLHLEPWTTSAVDKNLSDEQRQAKLNIMIDMRKDLEKLRLATGLVRRREKEKKAQATLIYELLADFLFPHEAVMRNVLEKIATLDRNNVFRYPIVKQDLPEYFEVVQNPLSWQEIDERLERHEYWDVQAFVDDVNLVLDNAMAYNKKDTAFYKLADRIKTQAVSILAPLDGFAVNFAENVKGGVSVHKAGGEDTSTRSGGNNTMEVAVDDDVKKVEDDATASYFANRSVIGDLEPTLDLVRLLCEKELVSEDPDMDLELTKTPVESLFSMEIPVYKPSPPTPPPREPTPQPTEATPPPASKLIPSTPSKKGKGKKPAKKRKAGEKDTAEDGAADSLATEHAASTPVTEESRDTEPKAEPEPTPEVLQAPISTSSSAAAVEAAVSEEPPPALSREPPPSPLRPGVKRKRPSTEAAPLVMPDVVPNVDNRSSFTLFHQGWVLDAGTRRGGRQAPDLPPLPKKARKGDRAKSRLSVVATTAEENQTLNASESSLAPGTEHTQASSSSGSSQQPQTRDSRAGTTPQPPSTPPQRDSTPAQALEVERSPMPMPIAPRPPSQAPSHSPARLPSPPPLLPAHLPTPPPLQPVPERPHVQATPAVEHPPPFIPSVDAHIPMGFMSTPHASTSDPLQNMHGQRSYNAYPANAYPATHAQPSFDYFPPTHAPSSFDSFAHMQSLPQFQQFPATQALPLYDSMQTAQAMHSFDPMQVPHWQVQQSHQTLPIMQQQTPSFTDQAMPGPSYPTVYAPPPHAPPLRVLPRRAPPPRAPESGPSNFAAAQPSSPQKTAAPQNAQQRKAPPAKGKGRLNVNTVAPLRFEEGKSALEQGTLVWAKMQGFPWFPAIVFDESDAEVPPRVRASKTAKAVKENHHLVKFSSTIPSWGYLAPSQLQMLGDDLEADKLILEKQRYTKGNKERNEIQEAYRVTLAQMAPADYEPSVDEDYLATPDPQATQPDISPNPMNTAAR